MQRRTRFRWALVGLLVALTIYWLVARSYGTAAFLGAAAVLLVVRITYDNSRKSNPQVTSRTFAIYGSTFLVLTLVFAVWAVESSSVNRVLAAMAAVLWFVAAVITFVAWRKLSRSGAAETARPQ